MLTEDQLLDTWNRMRDSITWVTQQRVRNRETAVEIVCEAFCRAWKNREKWSPSHEGATADGWIFRIAANVTIDYVKSCRYRSESLISEIFEEIHPAVDPIGELEAQLLRELPSFDTIIAPCTPDQRRILDLRYRHELTYAAIGERVELSASACKSLANRGIRKIREIREAVT